MNRWTSTAPIHEQLSHHLIREMLARGQREGTALPSIRDLARRYLVNPMIAERALAHLRDKGWTQARAGGGDALSAAALDLAVEAERKQFLLEEWPELCRHLTRIGITASDLH